MSGNPASILSARNFYECLQVNREASQDEITRAFRQLAKQCHPDLAPKWISSNALFHRLREAYETLSNPVKKEIYDAGLAKRQAMVGAMHRRARSGAGFSAGKTADAGYAKQAEVPAYCHSPDLDMTAKIAIPWSKALSGGLQQVRLSRPSGGDHPLRSCLVSVSIPAACPAGHQIVVALYGRVDRARLRAGHLKIKVNYREDPRFRFVGPHLHTLFELNPWDTALGGSFMLESPLGLIPFEVPAGARHLQSIRVPGAGLPQSEGARGDLVICLKIRPVAADTTEQKRIWQALKKAHA